MAEFNRNDLAWGGKYHDAAWNPNFNANATIANCLANCTTLVIAVCIIWGLPLPLKAIRNANVWYKYLINGWKYKKFDKNDVKRGDIIEWADRCHVCIVDKVANGKIWVHASWYTGEHGKSIYNGSFDTRSNFVSMQAVSNFMVTNYPYRFYHYCTLDEEIKGAGGEPDYILYLTTSIKPDAEDKSKNQIHVLTDKQNVRNGSSLSASIVGIADPGYYDVFEKIDNDDYTWYQIEDNLYIAGVKGRVIYIPKTEDIDWKAKYEEIKLENEELRNKLSKINELSSL